MLYSNTKLIENRRHSFTTFTASNVSFDTQNIFNYLETDWIDHFKTKKSTHNLPILGLIIKHGFIDKLHLWKDSILFAPFDIKYAMDNHQPKIIEWFIQHAPEIVHGLEDVITEYAFETKKFELLDFLMNSKFFDCNRILLFRDFKDYCIEKNLNFEDKCNYSTTN